MNVSAIGAGGRPALALPAELSVVIPCYNERANVAPLIAALDAALKGIAWEAIVVDDDSPDGTAAEARRLARRDPRVRCVCRIGRRGLSSAVIEGALTASADFIAVIDGDMQHDETRLPEMLRLLRAGAADIVVASRHVDGGDAGGLASSFRHGASDLANRAARLFLPAPLTDPMSGYFMVPRPLFERLAPRLTGQGFKILLDLVLSAGPGIRVVEIPAVFRRRAAGESKLDVLVAIQFAALLLDKAAGGVVPLRFIAFAAVGAVGVLVHLAVLTALRPGVLFGPLPFEGAQVAATLVAMLANFQLNNVLTYRDRRLRGARLWRGLALFVVVCGLGAVANIGIANVLYAGHATWTLAGLAGGAIGVVWNYAVSSTLVWRPR